MRILCWNCRGLRQRSKVAYLRQLTNTHRPQLLFVMETRLSPRKLRGWVETPYFDAFDVVHPSSVRNGGGLCLAWSSSVSVHILRKSENFVCTRITEPNGISWILVLLYGHPFHQKRAHIWDQLSTE